MSVESLILLFVGFHSLYFVTSQMPVVSLLITVPREPHNQVIFEGETAVLKCSVTDLPRNAVDVNFSIRRNGQTIPSTTESQDSVTVNFLPVSNTDSGQYECIVSYVMQPSVTVIALLPKTLSLTVYSPTSSPVCAHDKASATVHVGAEVRLSCYFIFEGTTPTYQWQRLGNDAAILTSSFHVSVNKGVLHTVVGPFQMENDFQYLCYNTNNPSTQCNIQLMVQSIVSTPEPTIRRDPVVNETQTSTIATSKKILTSSDTNPASQTSNALLYVGIFIVLVLICVVVAIIFMYAFRSRRHVEKGKSYRDNIDHVYDNPVLQTSQTMESYKGSDIRNGGSTEPVQPVGTQYSSSIVSANDDIIVAFSPSNPVNNSIPQERTSESSGETARLSSSAVNTNDLESEKGGEIYNVIDEMYVDMSDNFKRDILESDLDSEIRDLGYKENEDSKYESFPLETRKDSSGDPRKGSTYMLYEDKEANRKYQDGCADNVEYTDMGYRSNEIEVSHGSQSDGDVDVVVTGVRNYVHEDFSPLYSAVDKTSRKEADNQIDNNRAESDAFNNDVSADHVPVTDSRINSTAEEEFGHLYSVVNKKKLREVDSKTGISVDLSGDYPQPRFVEISPSNSQDEDFSHLYTAIDKTKPKGAVFDNKSGANDATKSEKDTNEEDFSGLYSQVQRKPDKSK